MQKSPGHHNRGTCINDDRDHRNTSEPRLEAQRVRLANRNWQAGSVCY